MTMLRQWKNTDILQKLEIAHEILLKQLEYGECDQNALARVEEFIGEVIDLLEQRETKVYHVELVEERP